MNRIYKASGVIAMGLGLLFLIAILNVWFSLFQDNWLIKLYKLNAGSAINFDVMRGVNPMDIVILALVAMVYLGLYAALARTSKIWSFVAAVQPFLGLALFIVTGINGRSAVMGAGLVISCVMLRTSIFPKAVAVIGILASILLLIGDFGTTANSHSFLVSVLIGVGYLLLTTWFFLVGQRLFRLASSPLK